MADGFQLHKTVHIDVIIINSGIYPVRKAFPWRSVYDQEAVDNIEMQEKNDTHRLHHLLGNPLFPSSIFCSAGITAILAFLLLKFLSLSKNKRNRTNHVGVKNDFPYNVCHLRHQEVHAILEIVVEI